MLHKLRLCRIVKLSTLNLNRSVFDQFARRFGMMVVVVAVLSCVGYGQNSALSPNSIELSISPSDATVESGSSMQFIVPVKGEANSNVTWTAVLGSVNSSGVYTAPRVTSPTVDRVSAISTADPTKYATVDVVITPTSIANTMGTASTYSLASPPSATWYPYPSGTGGNGKKTIYNPVLAGNCYDGNCTSGGGILSHCWGNTSNCANGDAIAKFSVTGNGGCKGSPEVCGFFDIAPAGTSGASNASSDQGVPIYYATSSDPWYSLTTNGLNIRFHAPSGATYSGSTADQNIAIWDQAQQIMFSSYTWGKGAGFRLPRSTCTAGPSCAVSLNNTVGHYATVSRTGTDADFNNTQCYTVTTPGSYTLGGCHGVTGLGIQAFAGIVRFKELATGTINHAVQMATNCGYPYNTYMSRWTFPATSGLKPCSGAASNQPYAGMLLVCDYTSAQIAAMKLDPANAALITACSKYGWYFVATRGSGGSFTGFAMPGTGGWESNEAYVSTNTTNSDLKTISANNTHWLTCGNIGTAKASCYGYVFKHIGRVVGPKGKDAEGNSCTVAPGCYPSGHVHVIDSCVVKKMAGVSGGC